MSREFSIYVDENRSLISITDGDETSHLTYFPERYEQSLLEYQLWEHDRYQVIASRDIDELVRFIDALDDNTGLTLPIKVSRKLIHSGIPVLAKLAPHAEKIRAMYSSLLNTEEIYRNLLQASDCGLAMLPKEESSLIKAAKTVRQLHQSLYDRTHRIVERVRPGCELLK